MFIQRRRFATFVNYLAKNKQNQQVSIVANSSRNVQDFIGDKKFDCYIVGICQDDIDQNGSLKNPSLIELDASIQGVMQNEIISSDFNGSVGTYCQTMTNSTKPIFFTGLGKKVDILGNIPQAGEQAASFLKRGVSKDKTAGFYAPLLSSNEYLPLATHMFSNCVSPFSLKKEPKNKWNSIRCEILSEIEDTHVLNDTFEKASSIASGIVLTKDLVNSPPNMATPAYFATLALNLSEKFPTRLQTRILEKDECERSGMGLYLAVAQGSANPPKFIHMTYSSGTPKTKIALVGKGVTFDSGGYNLKAGPGSMIELMKFDCGGAAAVMGTALAISALAPDDIQIDFYIAACENMVSGNAIHPGAVVHASNGLSVEINNTDAEGRLTLADALLYAQKDKEVDEVIDIATLTGACIVALGNNVAGLYSNQDLLAQKLISASEASGDKIWRMPLVSDYEKELKSTIADMRNTGSRNGGSITAALFLQAFIDSKIPWAHLDIAGPVWDSKKSKATGFGTYLLTEYLLRSGKL